MGSVAMEVLKQTPLVRYARFETFDLDEARVEVARVFCPHTLAARGVQQASAFHNSVNLGGLNSVNLGGHNSVNLGGVTLNYMRYGIDIRINPGEMKNFYLLQIPVVGTARIHSGSHAVDASTMVATLLSPTLPVEMDWSSDCEKFLVQIDRGRLERAVESLLGRRIIHPLEFDVAFDRSGTRERIVRLVDLIREDIDFGEGAMSRSLAGSSMSEALIAALLGCQRHSYSAALEAPVPTIAPRHVKRAEEYMREHIAVSVSLADLADVSGVSVRALQDGFRRFRDTTPLEKLRSMRMEAARADLLAAKPSDSVTSIAMRWGFSHLSRFSVGYRVRYRESPSDTLRRGGLEPAGADTSSASSRASG